MPPRRYGEACLELGQPDDALKIYLRMVVQKSTDKEVRRSDSCAASSSKGLPTNPNPQP